MFSTILSDYCLECWRLRNEALHGNDRHSSREKKLVTIRKRVRFLYKRRKELGAKEEDEAFKMPIKKRLNLGIQSLNLWVGKVEELLRIKREKEYKQTLHHWLQP